ncbi:MAG: DUF362 domain-containing protein [Candidatus Thorarchaeota archaeon]|nr:DUF362 domain-containing protein [Candidatus Thorarchaeota archaeon]
MESVAIVRAEEDIEQALNNGFELIGGLGKITTPVLVKPNICTISDRTGSSVTDARVVGAIVKHLLRDNDSLEIRVIESDSQSKYAEEAYKKYGYKDLEKELVSRGNSFQLVNLSEAKLKRIEFSGLYFTNPELPYHLSENSYFVTVAIAKTHELAVLTGALKNQFGLLPRKDQSFYHPRIDDVIVDMNRIVRPDLSIIDARVGVEGWNGPGTQRIGVFIMGKEPVSVDATLTRVMGFEPEAVPHLMKASKFNLGHLDPPVLGESIESVRVHFEPKRWTHRRSNLDK